jgi:hypothetical protein
MSGYRIQSSSSHYATVAEPTSTSTPLIGHGYCTLVQLAHEQTTGCGKMIHQTAIKTNIKQVLSRCGRFTLVQTEEGFEWELTTRRGAHWYWNPATQSWTGACRPSRTPEAATLGLREALAREEGGQANEE